jgi:hypothetical protein
MTLVSGTRIPAPVSAADRRRLTPAPSRSAAPRPTTPRPATSRTATSRPATSRPGFVLYVGVDPQQRHEGGELVELAETLSEFAREWLPDAETYTALRLAEPGTLAEPATRQVRALRPAPASTPAADDVAAFRERLARISPVPRLVIDPRGRTVTVDDRPVRLTYKEFELLVHLARSPERPVTREELLGSVWDRESVREGSRTIDVHVRRVREKLDIGHVITTVRGVGYRFATTAEVVLAS